MFWMVLLYHESDLRIEEHYTDTSGFTDHVFALCHFLGFRFAPRIRDLADKRLYVLGKPSQWPALSPLIGGSLNLKLIEQQLDDRLAAVEAAADGLSATVTPLSWLANATATARPMPEEDPVTIATRPESCDHEGASGGILTRRALIPACAEAGR
jgi:TnpA family transposase